MTAPAARGQVVVGELEPGSAWLVLGGEVALDEALADLLQAELSRGGRVHFVLVLPRLGWSSDAALVTLHGRRVACVREQRLEELARVGGPRSTQITVSVRQHRWRRPRAVQNHGRHLTPLPILEGTVR